MNTVNEDKDTCLYYSRVQAIQALKWSKMNTSSPMETVQKPEDERGRSVKATSQACCYGDKDLTNIETCVSL